MLLLIDKPKGITSHDVVDRIRQITGAQKVGHGGTLDPQATGLLIVGVTRAGTKCLGRFQRDVKKQYQAAIYLGVTTNTHDADGEVIKKTNPEAIDRKKIASVLNTFKGTQKQIPPQYSAVKVNGRRAYKSARDGEDVDVPPRIVTVHKVSILSYEFPVITVTFTVSSGTYIRSLARDIGKQLGCGAHLKNLRRLQVGEFSVYQANDLDNIKEHNWRQFVVSADLAT
jgi:tRNA pseudouridine55 synthase